MALTNLSYDFANLYTVQNLEQFKKGKREEKKGSKFINFLGNKKKRMNEKSLKQKIIDAVTKTNDYTDANITAQAKKIGYTISEQEKMFIQAIAQSKISLKSAKVPKNLFKKKLCLYHLMQTLEKIDFLTDDVLIWELNWSKELTSNVKLKGVWEALINSESNCRLVEASVVSGDLSDVEKIKRGYMQDKSELVCAVKFRDKLTDQEYNDFIKQNAIEVENENENAIKYGEFKFDGITYKYRMLKSNVIIYDNETPIDEAIRVYENQIFIADNISKGNELKAIDKKKNILYISYLNRDLTTFCPGVVSFSKTVQKVYSMLKLELDYNDLYSNIELQNKNKVSALELPPNILFWDTYNEYFDFLLMLKASSSTITQELKTDITGIIDQYGILRPMISVWKDMYVLFKNIVLNFYDSVTSKITVDGTVKLKPNVDKFLSQYDILKQDNTYLLIVNLFSKLASHCGMIVRFLSTEIAKEVVQLINIAISSVMLFSDQYKPNEVIEYFNVAGSAVFQILFLQQNTCLVPEIRSGNAFLGDVANKLNKDTLGRKIEALRDKYFKKQVVIQNNIDNEISKYALARQYMDIVLQNTFNAYNQGELKQILNNNLYRTFTYSVPDLYNDLMKDMLIWMDDPDFDAREDLKTLNFLKNPYMQVVLTKLTQLNQQFKQKVNARQAQQNQFSDEVAAPLVGQSLQNAVPKENENDRRKRLELENK